MADDEIEWLDEPQAPHPSTGLLRAVTERCAARDTDIRGADERVTT